MINVPGYKIGGILFSREQIRERVKELGKQITEDYNGEPILAIGILRGAAVFMSDLVREIDLDVEMDFMMVSSYGSGTMSSGNIVIKRDAEAQIEGRNVLIVEDIIDTGRTLYRLKDMLLNERHAKTVKLAAMFNKEARRCMDIEPDYFGFHVDDLFLLGYGLDHDQKFRNLPDVTYLVEAK